MVNQKQKRTNYYNYYQTFYNPDSLFSIILPNNCFDIDTAEKIKNIFGQPNYITTKYFYGYKYDSLYIYELKNDTTWFNNKTDYHLLFTFINNKCKCRFMKTAPNAIDFPRHIRK